MRAIQKRLAFMGSVVLALSMIGCASVREKQAGPSVARAGLAACWAFDEGSGTKAIDESGNGNDGAIHGAQYVKVGDGYALHFSGYDAKTKSGNWVEFGWTAKLNPRHAITLEAWVKSESEGKEGLWGVIGKSQATFGIYQNPSNQYRFHVTGVDNLARSAPVKRDWAHIVGTFDGKTIKVYVNGELSAETPSKFDWIIEGKDFFVGYLGDNAFGDDQGYYWGLIGEARVYRRALCAEEVKGNYEATRAPYVAAMTPETK